MLPLHGTFKQVNYFEISGPFSQITEVEFPGTGFQHTENIQPLMFGDFAAQAVQFQLGEDGIFRAGKFRADFAFECEALSLGASQLGL